LKAWVSAHVYLGLSLIVIATLHTGFQFGWNVHTLAYGLMLLVIASGAFGVWAYATLPKALSDNRGETTRKQMLAQIHGLDELIHEAAQPLHRAQADIVRVSLENTDIGGGFWRRLFGYYGDCANARGLAQLAAAVARGGQRHGQGRGPDATQGRGARAGAPPDPHHRSPGGLAVRAHPGHLRPAGGAHRAYRQRLPLLVR